MNGRQNDAFSCFTGALKHLQKLNGYGADYAKKAVFKVFMNNLMPIKEIDNTVRELCNKIKSHFHTTSKYYRSNECIAADYTEMLSSVTFYIEIRINEIRI